jgi:hypothetical protein
MFFSKGMMKSVLCFAFFFLPGIAKADFYNCGNCKKWINGQLVRISNVKVEIFENGKRIGSGLTNSQGEYCIRCYTSSIRNTSNMYEVFSKNGYKNPYNWLHICDVPITATPLVKQRAINVHTTNIGYWYPGR